MGSHTTSAGGRHQRLLHNATRREREKIMSGFNKYIVPDKAAMKHIDNKADHQLRQGNGLGPQGNTGTHTHVHTAEHHDFVTSDGVKTNTAAMPNMVDDIHKRNVEGVNKNQGAGVGTWQPTSDKERIDMSNKLADKTMGILDGLPTIGGPAPVPAWKKNLKKK